MIVVDSSAVVAILFAETSAQARLAKDPDRIMSVACYLETGTVLAGRRRSERFRAVADLDRLLDEAGIVLPRSMSRRRVWRCERASGLAAAWGMAGG